MFLCSIKAVYGHLNHINMRVPHGCVPIVRCVAVVLCNGTD